MDKCQDHTSCIERIRAVEESTKSAHHRIDEIQESQKILMEMNANIKLLAEQNKTQNKEICEVKQGLEVVKKDIVEIKEKPVKRVDTIVNAFLVAAASGLAGAILALILNK